jgi:hypothetical protein
MTRRAVAAGSRSNVEAGLGLYNHPLRVMPLARQEARVAGRGHSGWRWVDAALDRRIHQAKGAARG